MLKISWKGLFLYWSPSLYLCTVFDSISSDLDEVLSMNPSVNAFVFGDFHVHHKNWLTYSGGTYRPSELCYNFSISTTLLRWLTFLLRSETVILTVLLFWIYFFLLMLVFVLQLLVLKFWSCCCLSFHWLSIKFTMGRPVSLHSFWLFLRWLGRSLWSFKRCSVDGYL